MMIYNGTCVYNQIFFDYRGKKYKAEIESIWGIYLDILFYKRNFVWGFIPSWKLVTGLNYSESKFPNHTEYGTSEMLKMFEVYKSGDLRELNRLNELKLKGQYE